MRMIHKLRASKGESLLEALAAVLVVTFSCLMLYFSTVTAARVNMAAEETNARYRLELSSAELQGGGADFDGTVTVTSMNPGDSGSHTEAVAYYGGDGELTSYRMAEGAG